MAQKLPLSNNNLFTPALYDKIFSMRNFLLAVFLCVAALTTTTAQSVAIIEGQIQDPLSFMHEGKMHRYGIKFYPNSTVFSDEYAEIPDSTGFFRAQIVLPQNNMPITVEYSDQFTTIFLSAQDTIKMKFVGEKMTQSLEYKGKNAAALANNYIAKFNRLFDTTIEDESLFRKIELSNRYTYQNHCDDFKNQHTVFLTEYVRQNPQLSEDFQKWAKAEITYRAALRMQEFYFNSRTKSTDDYRTYATSVNWNDQDARNSYQYQSLLDMHLRQLAMRDPESLRSQREANRLPWVVRGMELSEKEYKTDIKELAQAKLLINLIEAEYAEAGNYYNNWIKTNPNPILQQAVGKRYGKYTDFLNAPPPANAHLYIPGSNNPISFKQLTDRYKGKVIYIDIWASWCAPCLSEMPYSQKLYKEYSKDDIVFVYLAANDSEGKWRANIARHNVAGEHYLMDNNLQQEAYINLFIRSIPHYALIDKQGKIVDANAKHPSNPELRNDIQRLLYTE